MVKASARPRGELVTYKTRLSLYPREWAAMAMWAELRGVTGHELIQAILSNWLHQNPPPEGAPPPEGPDGDEGDELQ